MNKEPSKIILQVRAKDNEHLMSLSIAYKSKKDLEFALTTGIPALLSMGILTVEHNDLNWKLNGTPMEKSIINGSNAAKIRQEVYDKTGN